MPRYTRLELPQLLLHVIQRGVNRGAIVVDDDDQHHFLDLLHDAAREHDLAIHAYVLMGNHVRLLLITQGGRCPIQRHAPLWPMLRPSTSGIAGSAHFGRAVSNRALSTAKPT